MRFAATLLAAAPAFAQWDNTMSAVDPVTPHPPDYTGYRAEAKLPNGMAGRAQDECPEVTDDSSYLVPPDMTQVISVLNPNNRCYMYVGGSSTVRANEECRCSSPPLGTNRKRNLLPSEETCGNCWIRDKDGLYNQECYTGVNEEDMSPPTNHGDSVQDLLPTRSASGGSRRVKASSLTIEKIKELFARESNVSKPANFNELFCASYLNQYKSGRKLVQPTVMTNGRNTSYDKAGSGAACVRGKTVEAIRAADRDARNEWIKWGSGGAALQAAANGYPHSFAIKMGTPSDDFLRWGTGWGGDLPSNWCGVFMKQMFCHMAFPQVRMGPRPGATIGVPPYVSYPYKHHTLSEVSGWSDAENDIDPDNVDLAQGRIRSVKGGKSLEKLFSICARRQPNSAETKSGFVPEEVNNTLATIASHREGFIYGGKMEAGAMQGYWRYGFGLSKAGPGVSDEDSEGSILNYVDGMGVCNQETNETYPSNGGEDGECTYTSASWSPASRLRIGAALALPLAILLSAFFA